MSLYQRITDELINIKAITKTELHGLTPPDYNGEIIPSLLKFGINSKVVAQVVAQECRFNLYDGLEADVVVDNDIVYLTNPLDILEVENFLIAFNTGKISFNKIGIKAANNKKQKNQSTLINDIINLAIDNNATDIHASPRNEDTVYIRARIQGQLIKVWKDVPFSEYEVFVNLILNKINKQAGVFAKAVDGQFTYNDKCSIRVSMLPVNYIFSDGYTVPRITLRLLTSSEDSVRSLSDLNLLPYVYQKLTNTTTKKQGLIYITGPTGSGKSTTCYMLIKEIQLKMPAVSIATVEDPIENNLPGVDQTQINNKAGISFSTVSKAFMRLDPDVILIGETRDEETAKNTMTLANTGHLTISTLHTNDGISVVSRLYDLGVSYGQVADMLTTVLATRLVRKLCVCATNTKIKPGDDIYNRINNYFPLNNKDIIINTANNCSECNNGYIGRILVCEVFTFDKKAKEIITSNFSSTNLTQHFRLTQLEGFFWHYAFNLLLDGVVSYEELMLLLPEDPLFDSLNIIAQDNIVNKDTFAADVNNTVINDNTTPSDDIPVDQDQDNQTEINTVTINEVVDIYIVNLEKTSIKGVKTKINNLKKVIKKFDGSQDISVLTLDNINNFKIIRLKKVNKNSADSEVQILVEILKFYNETQGDETENKDSDTAVDTIEDDNEYTPDELSSFLSEANN